MKFKDYTEQLTRRSFENKNDKYGIDPMTILTVVSIIMRLVSLIMKWYQNRHEASRSIKRLGFFQKMFLWRYAKKEAKDKEHAKYLYSSVEDLVYSLSEKERFKLFSLYEGENHEI